MTDFTITNKSAVEVKGEAGADRLSFTYDTTTNGVWLTNLSPAAVGASAPVAGGYSGLFDGYGSNNVWFSGIEHFTFTDLSGGNDDIRAGDGDDVLNGGAGNDRLAGWGGINRIDGGAGTDFAQLAMGWTSEALYIDLNGSSSFLGNGLLTNVEGVDLTTGSGNDTVIGHQSSGMADVVKTGSGNDRITLSMGGSDTVDGGAGSDLLTLTYSVETNDVWLTNLAADTVSGGYKGLVDGYGSNDVWFSGIERFSFTDLSGGNDNIRTGNGADTLNGGAGDDILKGAGGADVIDGGLGKDLWGGNFATASSAFNLDLNGISTLLTSGSVRNVEAMELVTGSGNDTITGHQTSAMADSVKTGSGNDRITLSMGGSDTVDGGTGSDLLTVTYSVETNDVWLTNLAADTVSGGYKGLVDGYGSNDVWFSGIERFSFTDLSGGNDNIRTGNGADTLRGGVGDDKLTGAGGADVIDGGAGKDHWGGDFAKASSAFNINLNGISTLLSTGSVRNIEGMALTTGTGNDTITGHQTSAMADSVKTGAGNDSIRLWMGGSDTVDGGAGSDVLTLTNAVTTGGVWLVSAAADTVTGGYKGLFDGYGSNDVWFSGIERFSFTDASGGNDDIRTGNGADTLRGGVGDDRLIGAGGADVIDGGLGKDHWGGDFAAAGSAFKIDLNGISTLLSTGSVRNIEGMALTTGTGNDTITGHQTSAMADSVTTGAGSDSIRLWMGGSDTVDGGAGSDVLTVTYKVETNGVWLTNLAADTVSGGYKGLFNGMGSNDVWFSGIEHFSFTDASGGNDIIRTGNGADTLNGGAGNDELNGGGGNDLLNGGAGVDTMLGGAGNDTYYVDDTADRVYETTTIGGSINAGGVDTVNTYLAAYTLGDFVENGRVMSTGTANLAGNSLANTIYAGKGSNVLAGGSGTDTLSYAYGANGTTGVKVSLASTATQATGGSGSDRISGFEHLTGSSNNDSLTGNGGANVIKGGSGNDTVTGGSGSDSLYGDAGNDLVRGGAGNDVLYGGAGRDLFRFDSALSTATAKNVDKIMDFSVVDDTIQLENSIFTKFGTTTGTIGSGNFRANTTGRAADANDYIIYETDTGKVFYDADGSGAGASIEIAVVGTSLALTYADFVLV